MEYATYILGKDDCKIDPYIKSKSIRVTQVTDTGVGYEITFKIPLDILIRILNEE